MGQLDGDLEECPSIRVVMVVGMVVVVVVRFLVTMSIDSICAIREAGRRGFGVRSVSSFCAIGSVLWVAWCSRH